MTITFKPVTSGSPLGPQQGPADSVQEPDPAADRAEFAQNCERLKNNFVEFDGWFDDGNMDMNELYAAERGEKGPELKTAALFLTSHLEYLKELDGANDGGKVDGKVSRLDVETQIGRLSREQQLQHLSYDNRLPELRRAVDAIAQNWDAIETAGGGFWADGRMTEQDLRAVHDDPAKCPNDQVRDAVSFFLRYPEFISAMDVAAKGGNADGTISREDFDVFSRQLKGVQDRLPKPAMNPGYGQRY